MSSGRLFDPKTPPERTSMAWERTAFSGMVVGLLMARVGAKLLDAVLYGLVLPIPALVYMRMTYSGTGPGPRNFAPILMIGLIAMGFWLLSAAAEARLLSAGTDLRADVAGGVSLRGGLRGWRSPPRRPSHPRRAAAGSRTAGSRGA